MNIDLLPTSTADVNYNYDEQNSYDHLLPASYRTSEDDLAAPTLTTSFLLRELQVKRPERYSPMVMDRRPTYASTTSLQAEGSGAPHRCSRTSGSPSSLGRAAHLPQTNPSIPP